MQILNYIMPDEMKNAVKLFPNAILTRHATNNRLPIHVALANGIQWADRVELLLDVKKKLTTEKDPVTKLPHYALAAMGPNIDLETIFKLLLMGPEQ